MSLVELLKLQKKIAASQPPKHIIDLLNSQKSAPINQAFDFGRKVSTIDKKINAIVNLINVSSNIIGYLAKTNRSLSGMHNLTKSNVRKLTNYNLFIEDIWHLKGRIFSKRQTL